MKKLLFLFALILILCCSKKDEPRCWTCETWTKMYYSPTEVVGYPKSTYVVEAVCDFNEEGIKLYENSKSDTTINDYNIYKITFEKLTRCH